MQKINNYFSADEISPFITHFRLFPIAPTIEEFREHLHFLKKKVETNLGKKIIWIYDTEGALLVNSECRKEGGEFIKQHLNDRVEAIIFYNHSLLIDLSLKGMSLVTKLPFSIIAAFGKKEAIMTAEELISAQ